MNITNIIDEYRGRMVKSTNMTLNEASQMLIELSALLGNINEEIRVSESLYLNKLAGLLNEEKMTVSKAEILVKLTDEYQRFNKAKGYEKFTMEMIRGLKYRCRALQDEIEVSNNY